MKFFLFLALTIVLLESTQVEGQWEWEAEPDEEVNPKKSGRRSKRAPKYGRAIADDPMKLLGVTFDDIKQLDPPKTKKSK